MYTQDQIRHIKSVIGTHLESSDLLDKIKQKIKDENLSQSQLDDKKLLEILKQTQAFDNISQEIKNTQLQTLRTQADQIPQGSFATDSKRRGLLFKIGKGKAFLEYLGKESNKKLQFFVNFMKQRFSSNLIPANIEPNFNEAFLFDLSGPDQMEIDLLTLLKLNIPVELALIAHNADGSKSLLSTKQVDWRFVLSHGGISVNLELPGVDAKSKLSVGVIQISMDLMPKMDKIDLVPERVLDQQFDHEKKEVNNDISAFYDYTTEWWNDYKQLRPNFDKRPVKIYAEDEYGVYKPVFTFVKPLYGVKGIDSSYHAARFVGLIPYRRNENPGGDKKEVWNSFNTFLSLGYGDCENHAALLCSLLLGFGMDAYVAIGFSSDGPHTWVVTRMTTKGVGDRDIIRTTFWESLTGQRFEQKDPRVNSLYRRVGCVFNHKRFLANIQETESPFHVDFNFEDEFLWKRMSQERVAGLKTSQNSITLLAPKLDIYAEEDFIEKELRNSLLNFRRGRGQTCKFDDKLANMLLPALANYELERTTGQTFGQEEFQNAVKSYIPENHTFKAFPIQFNHRRPKDMFDTLANAPIAEDIINARGDSIFFAIKTKIYVFPENIHSVWVTIAVRFLELD